MDVLMPAQGRWRGGRPVATFALAMVLSATPGRAAGQSFEPLSDVTLKALFLYNFVKFAEWPALPNGAAIDVCLIADDGIVTAFTETVRGQSINGHRIQVWRPHDSTTWRLCHLLFIADVERRPAPAGLSGIKALPVLTVSDRKNFARADGIVELYAEDGRMRFAINVDGAARAGLRLSSRLLGLAKILRDGDVQ